jgi:hypothetical protein
MSSVDPSEKFKIEAKTTAKGNFKRFWSASF